MVANRNRLEALPRSESGTERAYQADILKAASMVDLEAHRLLTLVREHYGRGDLPSADAQRIVEALEQAGEILRRQRQSLLKPALNSTDTL
jgi:hypothetical protein